MKDDIAKIRVLIADDHQVVRQGLLTFLELQPDIVVVGEAADGLAAVEMVQQLQPHVVLMDLVMPGLDGIAATRKIRAQQPAGQASYLLKDVEPDELVEAIRAVHRGEARLHPDIARKLMEQVTHAQPGVHEASPAAGEPTVRELEGVRLVATGKRNQEV